MELYRGVIEDNNDIDETKKVRVRILGLHTSNNENSSESFNTIRSSDLPWASVMGGTEFGLTAGIGLSSVLPQGTWVWLFLEQNNPNKPVIIGTITGITKTRQKYKDGEGFNDKDGVFPFDARTDETDINRLATGKKLNDFVYDKTMSNYSSKDTIHKIINDNRDINTSITDATSGADVSQSEPLSLNDNTVYPNCSVLETPGGHIIEYDDTTGNERIRLYHTSGSYMEMRPDGSITQKASNTTGESHYIHMSDINEHIKGSIKKYIETNLDEIINGAVKRNIKSTLDEHIEGVMTMTVDGNTLYVCGSDLTFDVTGTTKVIANNVVIDSTDIKLGAAATEAIILGDTFQTYFNGHTHTGNFGAPTSAPIAQMPSNTLSSVSKTK